jgi:hypothetical protein
MLGVLSKDVYSNILPFTTQVQGKSQTFRESLGERETTSTSRLSEKTGYSSTYYFPQNCPMTTHYFGVS